MHIEGIPSHSHLQSPPTPFECVYSIEENSMFMILNFRTILGILKFHSMWKLPRVPSFHATKMYSLRDENWLKATAAMDTTPFHPVSINSNILLQAFHIPEDDCQLIFVDLQINILLNKSTSILYRPIELDKWKGIKWK